MTTLKFGGVASEESEVIIRLDKEDRLAHISSTWAEWSRKIAKRHGDPRRYVEQGGLVVSSFWILPLKVISVRSPQKPSQTGCRSGPFARKAPLEVPLPGKTPETGTLVATRSGRRKIAPEIDGGMRYGG